MIYQLEVINQDETLVMIEKYNNINDLMITYNELTMKLSNRKALKNKIIQVFRGDSVNNMEELKKYRFEF